MVECSGSELNGLSSNPGWDFSDVFFGKTLNFHIASLHQARSIKLMNDKISFVQSDLQSFGERERGGEREVPVIDWYLV